MSSKPQEIRALTGLRGLAALWVVMYHLHVSWVEPAGFGGPLLTLLAHGYLAVDIFFVLSGFVMALSYRHFFAEGFTKSRYGVFLLRRVARVYPLYLAITGLIVVMVLGGLSAQMTKPEVWHALPFNLLMVQGWGFAESILLPAWSISTEFGAYFLFPLLAVLVLYRSGKLAALVAVLCVVVLMMLPYAPLPQELEYHRGPLDITWAHTIWPLLRCLAGFTLGLAAFRAWEQPGMRDWASKPTIVWGVPLMMLVLLCFAETDVTFVVFVPLLVMMLANGEKMGRFSFGWLLATPPLMLLGDLSYAIYLWHFPLIRVHRIASGKLGAHLSPELANFGAWVVLYGALFALAYLSYRFFEKPARRLIRRLETRFDRDAQGY